MFWLIGTAFVLRNFLTVTTLGGSTRVFRENRDLLLLEGSGHLEKFRAPTDTKKHRKMEKKKLRFLFFVCFKKCVFVKNGAMFFVFGLWRPL